MPNGSYPFGESRQCVHEVKHFAAYSVEDGRNEKQDTWDLTPRPQRVLLCTAPSLRKERSCRRLHVQLQRHQFNSLVRKCLDERGCRARALGV